MIASLFGVCLFFGLTVAQSCTPPTSAASPMQFAISEADTTSLSHAYLGGLFAVHDVGSTPYRCGSILPGGIQHIEAFLWAVETYKDRYPGEVLSDADIGALVLDTCSTSSRAVQHVLNFETCQLAYGDPAVEPNRLLGWIGPGSDDEVEEMASLMNQLNKVLVSPISSGTNIEDPVISKTLLRTAPSPSEQARAIVAILKQQEWKYVQVVYSDDAEGISAMEDLERIADDADICIVNTFAVQSGISDYDMRRVIDSLVGSSSSRPVAMFLDSVHSRRLLQAANSAGVRGLFTWIGTSEWGVDMSVVQGLEYTAEGAITFTADEGTPGLNEFQQYFQGLKPETHTKNPWFVEYWTQTFQCDLPGQPKKYVTQCITNQQSLQHIEIDDKVSYIIKAVDATLHGIESARRKQCPGKDLCTTFINNQNKWLAIKDAVRSVNIPGVVLFDQTTGESKSVKYNVNNYRSAHNNCPDHCYSKVGQYNSATGNVVLDEYIFSYDNVGRRMQDTTATCPSSPCVECGEVLPASSTTTTPTTSVTVDGGEASQVQDTAPIGIREDTWVVVLLVLLGIGVLLVIAIEIFLLSKMFSSRYSRHMRTMWLGQLLLFAVFLCYLSLFAFVPKPTKASCTILRFGLGVSFAMCFSILLVKLMIILSSKKLGYLQGIFQVLMFFFAWGVQIVIDVEWLILREPDAVPDPEGGWMCKEDFESHVQSLVYVMFLIVMTTMIALKTHGIITNHREGVFIGLVAGFAIPVWLAWVLLGLLNNERSFQEPAMAFGLYATATLIIFIMFLPKVRQLNSMGVEGIYAEDDSPDGYTPSIGAPSISHNSIGGGTLLRSKAPSIISPSLGPSVMVSRPPPPGSVVYVDGGTTYAEPERRAGNFVTRNDSNAVYLLNPNHSTSTMQRTASMRSAPASSHLRRAQEDGRVLKITSDLTGRTYMAPTTARSEVGYPTHYGTTPRPRGTASVRSGSIRKFHSTHDLGSL